MNLVASCLVAVTLAGPSYGGRPVTAYVFIGPGTRIIPPISEPERIRQGARSEIPTTTGTTFARETPEEIATAPCVRRRD